MNSTYSLIRSCSLIHILNIIQPIHLFSLTPQLRSLEYHTQHKHQSLFSTKATLILSNSGTVVTADGTSIWSFFQYWNYLGSHTTAELHKNVREMKHSCPFSGEEQKLVENIDSNLNSIFKKKKKCRIIFCENFLMICLAKVSDSFPFVFYEGDKNHKLRSD